MLRYSSYRYNDKENNNLGELEIKKVRYEETEPDLGHTSKQNYEKMSLFWLILITKEFILKEHAHLL